MKIIKLLIFIMAFLLTSVCFFAITNLLIFYHLFRAKNFIIKQNFVATKAEVSQSLTYFALVKPVWRFLPYGQTISYLADKVYYLNDQLYQIVGLNGQKNYFILLQNNLELRPSGGFMGSYAKIIFKNAKLQELAIQDIYVPDGQIVGHVDPPWPIQTAFKQGFWKLRDSNWEPDFPKASQTISWFFEKGKEEKPAGIIALNFLVVKDLLRIIEPITIPDYDYKVTADTLYQITQNEVEKNFFPGSTQKKDFLSALGKQLILSLQNLNMRQQIQLMKVIFKHLQEKQILISVNNYNLASFFHELNWDGSLNRPNPTIDYIYLVDTNLGANKANCCVTRNIVQEVDLTNNNIIKEKVSINYNNEGSKERPKPPLFWGGTYENFLRIILPLEASNIIVSVNKQIVDKSKIEVKTYDDKKLKSVGFFVAVEPLSKVSVEITYEKPFKSSQKYSLLIQKQPGIESYSHILTLKFPNQKTINLKKNIISDTVLD